MSIFFFLSNLINIEIEHLLWGGVTCVISKNITENVLFVFNVYFGRTIPVEMFFITCYITDPNAKAVLIWPQMVINQVSRKLIKGFLIIKFTHRC